MSIALSHPVPFTLLQGLRTVGVIISTPFGAFTILVTLATLLVVLFRLACILGSDREWLEKLEARIMSATNRVRVGRHLGPIDLSVAIDE